MKTPTRLLLVFVMVAITATAVYAGRPQCGSSEPPPGVGTRVCFDEYSDDGYNTYLGFRTAALDVEGPTLVYSWASDDFGLIRPNDASYYQHVADSEVDLYICPQSLGWDCFTDLVNSPTWPAPLPGMWVGKTHLVWMQAFDANFSGTCPSTLQSNGWVTDPTGQQYLVRGNLVQVRNEGSQGCSVMRVDISITPKSR